jgi:hypothetical protein
MAKFVTTIHKMSTTKLQTEKRAVSSTKMYILLVSTTKGNRSDYKFAKYNRLEQRKLPQCELQATFQNIAANNLNLTAFKT